ncbi:MAG: Rieske 2Fe-2S domain-containing protein [Alphaproteobacteria bacterium]|uniref:Rieske 2Fe-2S domain-containing protein n=1 Tax=Candidatus Nitrobium versatile TaxID=2884831 RepID=A0A953JB80_9BACT|nr:Rieske 2Fe-2S domain-containing protein [Candidatus Nitrobium versatile]
MMLTLPVALSGAVALLILSPKRTEKKEPLFIPVLGEDELPKQGVKRIELSVNTGKEGQHTVTHRIFAVRNKGKLFILSSRCTHLGCLVEWSRSRKRFLCPCHGGTYDMEGIVAGGPPPRPLSRLPVAIRNGRVYVGIAV